MKKSRSNEVWIPTTRPAKLFDLFPLILVESASVKDEPTRPGPIHQTFPGNKDKYPTENKAHFVLFTEFFPLR